jgi:hypothetical protein
MAPAALAHEFSSRTLLPQFIAQIELTDAEVIGAKPVKLQSA